MLTFVVRTHIYGYIMCWKIFAELNLELFYLLESTGFIFPNMLFRAHSPHPAIQRSQMVKAINNNKLRLSAEISSDLNFWKESNLPINLIKIV